MLQNKKYHAFLFHENLKRKIKNIWFYYEYHKYWYCIGLGFGMGENWLYKLSATINSVLNKKKFIV